jgi:hypothetical protein
MNKTKVIKALNELLKEDESLKYALATNLAKYGRPQSKKSDKPAELTKGLEKGREKYVKDLKKAGLDEATPVSVGLNMDQTDAVYKVLEDNFGEEHIKDMFTLGSLSFYNMMVKGGIAGVFKEGNINEESYTVAGKSVTLNKGKKLDGTDWTVTFLNGKETSLSDVLSLIKPFPKGITKENINEDKADAARWFGNLKSFYLKAFRELKGEDQATYKTLIKNWANGLSDNKVGVNEQPDVLNKIADMFDRKYPHLTFDVNTMLDRIEVRGDDQDVFTFGEELAGQKIFDYEITTIDKEGRNYEVRIVRSDSIVRNAVNPTNEEKADRCLRIARREIPQSSAYRSGLIVKCRKGMIWKDKK